MQSYISHRRGRVFNPLIFFFFSFDIILLYWFVTKNVGNYRKYDIFFNFRFTENKIFSSNAETHENIIFTFFMQWFDCYMSKNWLGPNREQSGNKKREANNKKWPVFDHGWQGTDVKSMWKRSVRTISVCFLCSKRYWWTCET